MRSGSRLELKREGESDGKGWDGAAEAWRMTDHRERVKEMTARMAAEAGLVRSDRAGGGHSGRRGMTAAAEMDMTKHPEPRGEAVLSTIKTPRYDDCSGLIQGKKVAEVADYLEQKCHCGISALYLQGANFSCVSGWLRVWGNIQALSDHQKALIIQTSHMKPASTQGDVCSAPTTGRYTSTASALGLQIGLIIAVLLLLGLGAALFTYFYRRRRPLDYYTMELSEHAEGLADL